MVAEYGMSERLGCARYGTSAVTAPEGRPLDGGISPEARNTVDDEVRRILAEQYERAHDLLARHHEALSRLTENLLEAETLDGEAVGQALLGVPLPAVLDRSTARR
jgi:cell division protease FtsH